MRVGVLWCACGSGVCVWECGVRVGVRWACGSAVCVINGVGGGGSDGGCDGGCYCGSRCGGDCDCSCDGDIGGAVVVMLRLATIRLNCFIENN